MFGEQLDHLKFWYEIAYYSQTSTAQQFGNGYVVSSHILLDT